MISLMECNKKTNGQKLLEEYSATKSQKKLDEAFNFYEPLASRIVARYYSRSMPYRSLVQKCDMLNDAYIGLIQAIKAYDPDSDCSFKTFASYRIRGAIIDGLRSLQNFSRRVSRVKRAIIPYWQQLAHELCREPTIYDILERFPDIKIENSYLRDMDEVFLIEASVFSNSKQVDTVTTENNHEDNETESRIKRQEAIKHVTNVLTNQNERSIVFYYYFCGMNSLQISKMFSKSTHWTLTNLNNGVRKLKEHAKNNPDFRRQITDNI